MKNVPLVTGASSRILGGMGSDRLQRIRQVQRFTNKGVADCKHALDEASGSVKDAVIALLDAESFAELEQAFRVRDMAGDSIKDPITREEAKLMQALREHFRDHAWGRPVHLDFAARWLPSALKEDPSLFQVLSGPRADEWLSTQWDLCAERHPPPDRFPPDGLSAEAVAVHGDEDAILVSMPATESENEADMVVVLKHEGKGGLFRRRRTALRFLAIHDVGNDAVSVRELTADAPDGRSCELTFAEGVGYNRDSVVMLLRSITWR